MKTTSKYISVMLLLFVTANRISFSQTIVTQTYNTSGTFTVPNGVSSISVECWGAGGGGGTRTSNGVGGGGGGGAYASNMLSVTPGNYPVVVGVGGATGATGGSSSFNINSVVALGGGGVVTNSAIGGIGGTAAGSTGSIKYSGGSGANGLSGSYGGGGGGGAGSNGTGGNATSAIGGTGTTNNGGNGGNGRSGSQGNGTNGFSYGGGGGGAYRTLLLNCRGGNGANGLVVISYSAPYYRTKASGDWSIPGTWEVSSDNVTWSAASTYPTFDNSRSIIIQNTHNILLDVNMISVDDMIIETGGSLTCNIQRLTIADGSGIDLTNNGSIVNDFLTEIANNGTINNNGTIINGPSVFSLATITNNSIINNHGTINNGTINNIFGAAIYNNGTINNNGTIRITIGQLTNNNTYNEGSLTSVEYATALNGTIINNSGSTITILSTGHINLTTNRILSGALTNNGAVIDMGSIYNDGSFINNALFDYYMTKGSISGTNDFVYGTAGILLYHGSIAQTTSHWEFPSAGVPYVTVNNSNASGLTLDASKLVIGSAAPILTLTNGPVNLNSNKLTIQNSATNAIVRTSGYILSNSLDQGFNSILQWNTDKVIGYFEFPFGVDASTYIPLGFNVKSGGAGNVAISTYRAGVSATNATTVYTNRPTIVNNLDGYAGNGNPGNAENIVKRFWKIEPSSQGVVDLTFTYPEEEIPITGEEANSMVAQRFNISTNLWDPPLPGQISNTTTNTVKVSGVVNFSPWAISKKGQPLPVVFLNYEAKYINGKVEILWSTVSETNNDFFTVEKSKYLTDISIVGTVAGSGNSNDILNYAVTDKNPGVGTEYYRIRQTDYDGSFFVTDWMTVEVPINNAIGVSVDNSLSQINISFGNNISSNFEISVYDLVGHCIYSVKRPSDGESTLSIDLKDHVSGIYIVNVSSENYKISKKIILE